MKQWFKFYGGEYISDSKMKTLNAIERSCWIMLLSYASISKVEGEVMYLTEEQLLIDSAAHMHDGDNTGVLEKFEKLGMISRGNIGQIVISHWRDRQSEKALSEAERRSRSRERSKVKGEISQLQENQFSEFWNEYPRKVGKPKAFEKWCIINPSQELKTKILASVKEHAKSPQWQKDGGQYIPHPTTWLNQERWNDETTIQRPKVGGGKFENVKSTKV